MNLKVIILNKIQQLNYYLTNYNDIANTFILCILYPMCLLYNLILEFLQIKNKKK